MQKININKKNNRKDLSWDKVATWYNATINKEYSFQKEIIEPNLLKVLSAKKVEGKNILEIGCGTGIFLSNYLNANKVVGVDIGEELLKIGRENFKTRKNVDLINATAEKMNMLNSGDFDFIISVESLSNMERLDKVSDEVARLLKKGGEFVMIINHPAFRIPKHADWYYDKNRNEQGRVVYKYKTQTTIKIDMNPGEKNYKNKKFTYTFHRPISDYINIFCKNELSLNLCLEICSAKKSQNGPRKKAEDKAREEIPMFLLLRFKK